MVNGNPNTNNAFALSEQYVQDCFHSYLKSSLTQAKVERLLDTDVLSSAEADLMITGPALCLYFAALRSTTNPPSVPLPRLSKSHTPPTDLSLSNCPPTFRPFLIIWSQSVPSIQSLPPEYQHDLARIICNLPPISQPLNPRLNGVAADLRAVAIEISMRRTFQDRYANDLQAAIDSGGSGLRVKASFVPPPTYNAPSSPLASSRPSISSSVRSSAMSSLTPLNPLPPSLNGPHSPTILTPDAPAIEFIRETLYAALAEVLERMPTLRHLLVTDPTRTYFAAVAFAILDVATSSTSRDERDPAIRGVLGQILSLGQCPKELQPFMAELCAIGRKAREMEEEDSLAAVEALQNGKELALPRFDRVKDILEGGVGYAYNEPRETHRNGHSSPNGRSSRESHSPDSRIPDPRRRTTSTENRAVAFANRINALALGMSKLRAFRERQEAVFKVLSGAGSKS